MLNLSRTSLANIEKGRQAISLKKLFLLTFILDTPLEEFVSGIQIRAEDYLSSEMISALESEPEILKLAVMKKINTP